MEFYNKVILRLHNHVRADLACSLDSKPWICIAQHNIDSIMVDCVHPFTLQLRTGEVEPSELQRIGKGANTIEFTTPCGINGLKKEFSTRNLGLPCDCYPRTKTF